MASGTHNMIFATGEPAYAVDRDGTIVAWNAAASRAFGYPDSHAIGKKCWDLLRGQDAFGNQYCSEHCPLREMAFQHKAVNRCRMSFRTADDELQAFNVTTLVLFDTRDATLIHMCRKEPSAALAEGSSAPVARTQAGTRRADAQGAGSPESAFRRPHDPRDRHAVEYQCPDRAQPHRSHFAQTACAQPPGGRRGQPPARTGLSSVPIDT